MAHDTPGLTTSAPRPDAGAGVSGAAGADRARLALANVVADAALWSAVVLCLGVFRLLLVWLFRDQLDDTSGADQILRCVTTGLRFDVKVASFSILPSFLLTLAGFAKPLGKWHERVRGTLAVAFALIGMITFVVDVAYLREYHDQFNHWIFGLVFDDRTAIAQTVWQSYPVIRLVLFVAAATAALVWAGRRVARFAAERLVLPARLGTGWARPVTPFVLLCVVFVGNRASLESRPLQVKDAAVTSDPYLNKLVLNPFSAFANAVDEYRLSTRPNQLTRFLPDRDVRAAARACFPGAGDVTDLDEATKRTASGPPGKPARHVFLVTLESYDSWGLRPENAALRATERLAALGRDGIAADAFVSEGDGTMSSLAAIVTGLPDTGVHVNYQPSVKHGVPTDTASIFARLGYRPRFFYGGYLSWQRLGDFCGEHGFEEVHGGGDMSERLTGNEWGVDDEDLYAFVLRQLDDRPSFNLIMTTSYHPPYTVDLAAEGFRTDAIEAELRARGFGEEETRILGHLWYSDRALGDFVAATLEKFPDSVFAITGDHWSRRAFRSRPILYGQRAVPFVLHGPQALEGVPRPERIAGSHLDMVPTLVELTAPRGFTYHSFGSNMLDAARPQIGYGNQTILTPDVIVDAADRGQVQDMQGRPAHDRVPVEAMRLHYRQLHALGWWRVMKGKDL